MCKRVLCVPLALGVALVLAGCSTTLSPSPASTAVPEPANLTVRKQQVASYVNTGEYGREIARVALEANKFLTKRAPRLAAEGRKIAVVFDIDDTTLTNYPHILANDFGSSSKIWAAWVAEGRAHAIIPVQTVYDTALRLKLEVFFITGRTESERLSTEKNLRDVGYEAWTGIYCQPDDYKGTTRAFKTGVRRKLVAEGHVILANIGDQASDLEGGRAERTFKLPNPFYLTE
jgi:predicted secreted acid phosphatase